MRPQEPDEDDLGDEAEEVEEAPQPGYWLLHILREMMGGPEENEAQ